MCKKLSSGQREKGEIVKRGGRKKRTKKETRVQYILYRNIEVRFNTYFLGLKLLDS